MDWKKIIINKPQLQRLRSILRFVIKLAIDDKFKQMNSIRYYYREKLTNILRPVYQKVEEFKIKRQGVYSPKEVDDFYKKICADDITPLQRKRISNYNKRLYIIGKFADELLHDYHKSVLFCSMGSMCMLNQNSSPHRTKGNIDNLDEDMGWNPVDKEWICVTCYEYFYGIKVKREIYRKEWKKRKAGEKISEKYFHDILERATEEDLERVKKFL